MGEHLMSTEDKEANYDVTIEVKMPGQARASTYKIPVKARNNAEALAKGEEAWRKATDPCDIRVKRNEVIEGS